MATVGSVPPAAALPLLASVLFSPHANEPIAQFSDFKAINKSRRVRSPALFFIFFTFPHAITAARASVNNSGADISGGAMSFRLLLTNTVTQPETAPLRRRPRGGGSKSPRDRVSHPPPNPS